MAALLASVIRSGNTARCRVSLLTLVVFLAAGSSASGDVKSARADRGGSGGSPSAHDFPNARKFVDAHNAIRAVVQKPEGYSSAWTPVPPLTWSDEVASTAQAWAEHLRDTRKCGLLHSGARYGENLAAGRKVDAVLAVRMWAGEVDKYSYSPKYVFDTRTGHYTQVVWRKTTHIGCGRATCGRNAVVVCRYSPAGNRIDKAPY